MKKLILITLALLTFTQMAFANRSNKTIVLCENMQEGIHFKLKSLIQPIYPPKKINIGEVFVDGQPVFSGTFEQDANKTVIVGGRDNFEELKVSKLHHAGFDNYNVKLTYFEGSYLTSRVYKGCRLIKEVSGASAHN